MPVTDLFGLASAPAPVSSLLGQSVEPLALLAPRLQPQNEGPRLQIPTDSWVPES